LRSGLCRRIRAVWVRVKESTGDSAPFRSISSVGRISKKPSLTIMGSFLLQTWLPCHPCKLDLPGSSLWTCIHPADRPMCLTSRFPPAAFCWTAGSSSSRSPEGISRHSSSTSKSFSGKRAKGLGIPQDRYGTSRSPGPNLVFAGMGDGNTRAHGVCHAFRYAPVRSVPRHHSLSLNDCRPIGEISCAESGSPFSVRALPGNLLNFWA
jgi:hypothetical protein